jgi:hypothetical protein
MGKLKEQAALGDDTQLMSLISRHHTVCRVYKNNALIAVHDDEISVSDTAGPLSDLSDARSLKRVAGVRCIGPWRFADDADDAGRNILNAETMVSEEDANHIRNGLGNVIAKPEWARPRRRADHQKVSKRSCGPRSSQNATGRYWRTV